MMKGFTFLLPPLALVAACSGGGSDQIQPGLWETTSEMTDIELPGMPEALAAQMKAQLASQKQTRSQCITPEQAANPGSYMLNQDEGDQRCEFSDTTFAKGRINVRGTCPGMSGTGSSTMSWEGQYTAQTMDGRVVAEVQGPAGPQGAAQTMRMSGTLTSRRVGDCPQKAS